MSIQVVFGIISLIALAFIAALVIDRKRRGELTVAANLILFGAVVLALEHPQFAIAYSVPFAWMRGEIPGGLIEPAHARLHFFMAGLYALIGLALVVYIARTWLLAGRPEGWTVIACVAGVGLVSELAMGAWYPHGSPLYMLFGVTEQGWGWSFLYVGYVAWIAALAISYHPIFVRRAGSNTD